jgi:hypothetical protein
MEMTQIDLNVKDIDVRDLHEWLDRNVGQWWIYLQGPWQFAVPMGLVRQDLSILEEATKLPIREVLELREVFREKHSGVFSISYMGYRPLDLKTIPYVMRNGAPALLTKLTWGGRISQVEI